MQLTSVWNWLGTHWVAAVMALLAIAAAQTGIILVVSRMCAKGAGNRRAVLPRQRIALPVLHGLEVMVLGMVFGLADLQLMQALGWLATQGRSPDMLAAGAVAGCCALVQTAAALLLWRASGPWLRRLRRSRL